MNRYNAQCFAYLNPLQMVSLEDFLKRLIIETMTVMAVMKVAIERSWHLNLGIGVGATIWEASVMRNWYRTGY